MRMMFAVGRLNRVRSKIVVAGRLREAEEAPPLAPPRKALAGSHQVFEDGAGRPKVDRVRGRRDPIPRGIGKLRDHEGGSRVH